MNRIVAWLIEVGIPFILIAILISIPIVIYLPNIENSLYFTITRIIMSAIGAFLFTCVIYVLCAKDKS